MTWVTVDPMPFEPDAGPGRCSSMRCEGHRYGLAATRRWHGPGVSRRTSDPQPSTGRGRTRVIRGRYDDGDGRGGPHRGDAEMLDDRDPCVASRPAPDGPASARAPRPSAWVSRAPPGRLAQRQPRLLTWGVCSWWRSAAWWPGLWLPAVAIVYADLIGLAVAIVSVVFGVAQLAQGQDSTARGLRQTRTGALVRWARRPRPPGTGRADRSDCGVRPVRLLSSAMGRGG